MGERLEPRFSTREGTGRIGVLGMGVMGRNLALNLADHDVLVVVWNRSSEASELAVQMSSGRPLHAAHTLSELVHALERPRSLMLMVPAGAPVDEMIERLVPLLEPGDLILDGGNSWFSNTERREAKLRDQGLSFMGVGVSGGEEGARYGPSLMAGGSLDAYQRVAPLFEAIAAKTDSGACVARCGPGGAGHFVKMVHNGIEYADMQLIAEAYDVLRKLAGLSAPELSDVFERFNQGPLESFLIEITAKVLKVKDPQGEGYLVDQVLDKAGQKGTGRWTVQAALDLGVPVPSIAAAIAARELSSMKAQRVNAGRLLRGPQSPADEGPHTRLVERVHDALLCAKVIAYAQGMALIRAGSEQSDWQIPLSEMARIWKGGCIIRARLLDPIMRAFQEKPALDNLLLAPALSEIVGQRQAALREVVALAAGAGIPVPALGASLSYFDAYRAESLPQNLTQAQRDAFGAHRYQRKDDEDGPFVHSDWLAH